MDLSTAPLYEPLTTDPPQLRLMKLIWYPSITVISCVLQTFELSKVPPYKALSYEWVKFNALLPRA